MTVLEMCLLVRPAVESGTAASLLDMCATEVHEQNVFLA